MLAHGLDLFYEDRAEEESSAEEKSSAEDKNGPEEKVFHGAESQGAEGEKVMVSLSRPGTPRVKASGEPVPL